MRKRIRKAQALLLALIALTGIVLGTGVTLLCLNLTQDDKNLTFYGLICLIAVAALCLSLPFLTQHRDSLVEALAKSTLLYGGDVNYLDSERFCKRVKKKDHRPIYCVHARIYGGNEIDFKEVRHAFALAFDEVASKASLRGYSPEGDFLFVSDKEEAIIDAVHQANEAMLKNEALPSFALLLGVSRSEGDSAQRTYQAHLAALIDEDKRPSLSLVEYKEAKEGGLEDFDLENEISMGRLTLDFDVYEHEGELLAFSNPDLYDSRRGQVRSKDLFHRADIYYVRDKLDRFVMEASYDFLKQHMDHKVAIRLGAKSFIDPNFLKNLAEQLKNREIPADSYYLMISATDFVSFDARAFVSHARGMGFHIGLYEYGGEDVLTLLQVAPELMTLKRENLRPSANANELEALISIVNQAKAKLLIEQSDAFHDRSMYVVPRVEEETNEEEVAQ